MGDLFSSVLHVSHSIGPELKLLKLYQTLLSVVLLLECVGVNECSRPLYKAIEKSSEVNTI